MAPKLDKNVLASALLRKNKRKQARLAEVVSRGSDTSVNAFSVTPSSNSKAQTRKRRSSPFPNEGVTQPSTSKGKDKRSSDHSHMQVVERLPLEVFDLRGMC